MSSIPLVTDGDYTVRALVAPTVVKYPFANYPTKNLTEKIFERLYEIARGSYTPFAALATLPNDGTEDAADAAAYILDEGELEVMPDGTAQVRCVFGQIPTQKTIPVSYAFASPNFTPVHWASAFTTVPPGSYILAGSYAVIALASFTPTSNPVTTAVCEAITGYYDQVRTISAYTGNPATVLTIASHGCVNGSRLLYRRTDAGMNKFYYFDVTSVAGNDLTGTSTLVAQDTGTGAGMSQYMLPLVLTAVDRARKRTRSTTDRGETINLVAEIIEDFYLPGVSAGITTHTDITRQQPFQLASYLEQWASAGTWFNVQATGIAPWRGQLLKATYTRALRPTT